MANDKRFIVKNGLRADNVEFTDSQDGSNQITLNMLNTDTLNFEGDAGSLFSISDDLTGSVFSVGDISGIPIIEANGDTHNVTFNEFDGKVMIGGTDSGSTDSDVLNVTGNVRATAYYGDGSNLSGISASGGTDSATVSAIITADVDNAFVDALNVNAATVTSTANNTTNETVYLTFVDGATGEQGIETDTALSYNPSSNTLVAGVFSGSGASLSSLNASNLSSGTVSDARLPASISSDITGNAATATALATGRNIDVTGVTATAASFDGTGDIDIEVTAVPSSLLTGTIDSARLPVIASANDAGTLDGINSTSFLRSDAADTKTSGTLSFSDTVTLDFGAGVDLRLRSNGTNGYIEQTSGNSIVYKSGGHSFRNAADTEQLAKFTENSAVELYYDNSKKLETTTSGVTVTGELNVNLIEASGGVTYDPPGSSGTDTATDVGLALLNSQRIVIGENGYIRTIIDAEWGQPLEIGQSGTAAFGGTEIYGGSTSVGLFYNTSKMILTTSTGGQVNGDLTLTSTADNGAVLKLVSNDPTDAADFGVEGVVQFYAENDASESTLYYSIQLQTADVSDGSEDGWLYFNSKYNGAHNVANALGADGSMYILGSGNGGEGALKWFQTRSTSHTVSVKPNTPTASRNIFLPDADGTVLLDTGNQTLTGDLTFPDNEKAIFGSGSDLQVYHNGSNSFINNFVGDIYIKNGAADKDVIIQSDNGLGSNTVTYFQADGSTGSANLFHYGSIKLYTGANGVDVVGDLTLTSTDSGATENPTLDLYRNSASPADNDVLGHINFTGENDADEKIVYAEIETVVSDVSDGSEDSKLNFRGMISGSQQLYMSQQFGLNYFYRDILLFQRNLIFEGATPNDHETTLTVTDPTSDNTITLPDASGTVALQEQAYQAINAQTGTTYTTVLADGGKLVTLSNGSAITLTIPPNSSVAYPVGTKLDFIQIGAGQVTVAGGAGVTVNSTPTLKFRTQHSGASCIKIATDTWQLVGDLAES